MRGSSLSWHRGGDTGWGAIRGPDSHARLGAAVATGRTRAHVQARTRTELVGDAELALLVEGQRQRAPAAKQRWRRVGRPNDVGRIVLEAEARATRGFGSVASGVA